VAGYRLGVHEAGRGAFLDLEAQIGAVHVLEDHVEEAVGQVGLEELNDVGMLEFAADGRLAL